MQDVQQESESGGMGKSNANEKERKGKERIGKEGKGMNRDRQS